METGTPTQLSLCVAAYMGEKKKIKYSHQSEYLNIQPAVKSSPGRQSHSERLRKSPHCPLNKLKWGNKRQLRLMDWDRQRWRGGQETRGRRRTRKGCRQGARGRTRGEGGIKMEAEEGLRGGNERRRKGEKIGGKQEITLGKTRGRDGFGEWGEEMKGEVRRRDCEKLPDVSECS